MVQPAQDRLRDYVSKALDWSSAGRVLPQRNVGSCLVIVHCIPRKNAPEVLGVEHDQMVGALASDRPDQPLNIVCAENLNSHISVMQPADHCARHDAPDRFGRPGNRGIHVQ